MNFNYERQGQATIILIVIALSLSIFVVTGKSLMTVADREMADNLEKSMRSYYTAEAGIEDSLLRVIDSDLQYAATTTYNLNGGLVTISINQIGDGLHITAEGNMSNKVRRAVVNLVATSAGVSFHYGVQVGQGGITMKNDSIINGNLYANGDITAVNDAQVTGDVWAAGISTIDNLIIGGDAHANNIEDCTINGDAYYQTISGTSVDGTKYPGSPDPPVTNMSISSTEIDTWKSEAAAGGEISSYTLGGNDVDSLGPIKVNGTMQIKNDARLTITGPIWVNGDIKFDNDAKIQLDSIYGNNSEVLISDAVIQSQNDSHICGSEGFANGSCNSPTDSYLLLISTSLASKAIKVKNGANLRAVLYVENGGVEIENDAHVISVSAYSLTIKNSAHINYETGLVDMQFTSGPSGGWEIMNWREAE